MKFAPLASLVLLAGCASAKYDAWLDPSLGPTDPRAAETETDPPVSSARGRDTWRVRRVAGPPSDEPQDPAVADRLERVRWRRRRLADVHLHGVSFANAARLLAQTGGFDVAVEEGLDQPVSIDLRRVDAYDALVTLARNHGAAVERDGDTVIVRRDTRAKPK